MIPNIYTQMNTKYNIIDCYQIRLRNSGSHWLSSGDLIVMWHYTKNDRVL